VRYCDEVIAIDSDHEALTRAEADGGVEPRVRFIEGDVMTRPFALESFDAITLVATLHHLPLKLALQRFRLLLKTGGVLAVVGLYRQQTFVDYVFAAAAIPISFVSRCLHGYADVGAPQKNPKETLHDIRQECSASLPGAVLKRRLLFRYSLVWTKP
jgi:SAM-dependent methyltransferase